MNPWGWFWTLLLFVPLVGAGYWGARYALKQAPGWPRGLAAILIAWVWLTIGMQGLGMLGLLSRGPLLAWGLVGFALAALVRQVTSDRNEPKLRMSADSWGVPATIALGLVIWSCLSYGIPSLLLPVKVVSDGPIYHLPFAARWWKEGSLSLVASPFGESAATYFPINGELWFSWLMIAWGGDRLARVGQAPFLLLSAWAAFAMARRLGASRGSSALAVAWFVTRLPLLIFAFEPNVDTIFVAGYLLTCYFLLRYVLGDDGPASLFLAGLAAGASWGTKPTGTVFIPILLAAGGLSIFWREPTWRSRALGLGYLGGACLIPIGYWLGRNIWLTGNPLYPMHLELFGQVLLKGWYPTSAMQWSRFYLPRSQWIALGDMLLMVLDARTVPFWLASTVGLWALGRRPKTPLDRWVWAASALALVNIALFWLLIPYRTQQRFMLQAFGLAVIPLARLFDRGRSWRAIGLALLAISLFTPQDWPFPWQLRLAQLLPEAPNALKDFPSPSAMIPILPADTLGKPSVSLTWLASLSGILSLGASSMATAWLWSRWVARGRGIGMAASATIVLVALAILFMEFGPGSSPIRPTERIFPIFPDYQSAWQALDRATRAHPGRIAYAGTDLPYYLMGKDLRNDVRYINIDAHPSWLMHDYQRTAAERGDPVLWETSRPGWDRLHPDRSAWLDNLRRSGIDWLVVARAKPEDGDFNVADPDGFPIERTWAESLPESFQPIHGVWPPDPEMRVYRVLLEKKRDGSSRESALIKEKDLR